MSSSRVDRRVEVPNLSSFVRHRRQREGLSQAVLANRSGYSVGYIAKIEQGHQGEPSADTLVKLADSLSLCVDERRHLFQLGGRAPDEVAASADGVGELADAPLSEIELSYIDGLMPHLAAFVNDRWDVIYANAKYFEVYRELEEAGNVLIWFFHHPIARTVMVHWEYEARLTVAWLRSLMAGKDHDRFVDLLNRLSDSAQFRSIWSDQEIVTGRGEMPMLVRDPDTSTVNRLRAQVWPTPTRTDLQMYLGLLTSIENE